MMINQTKVTNGGTVTWDDPELESDEEAEDEGGHARNEEGLGRVARRQRREGWQPMRLGTDET